ncbi:MAG: PAS domain S-box protein [Planctomycetota bacterium]|nr:PAS domain S-box protein [Planctomycetota bacterium]
MKSSSKPAKKPTTTASAVPQALPDSTALEERLQIAEARLSAIHETTPDFILEIDRENRIQFINRLQPGIRMEDTLGTRLLDWIAEDMQPTVAAALQAMWDTGRPQFYQNETNDKGNRRWFDVHIGPIVENGKTVAGMVVATDITEQRLAELTLRQSEARYRTMVQMQSELVSRSLPDGTLTFVNEAHCRSFGKKPEELIGTRWFELVVSEAREKIKAQLAAQVANPHEVKAEIETNTVDGTRWQQWIRTPILDDLGNLVEFQSVGRDITDRKRIETELKRQERTLTAILQNMPIGIHVMEAPSGKPIIWNRSMAEMGNQPTPMGMLDLRSAEADKNYSVYHYGTEELFSIDQFPGVRALQGESSVADDIEIRFPDGVSRLLHARGAPILDDDGNVIMSISTVEDITQRKQAEEALLQEQNFHKNLLRAHERDRQLMAYEIHDGLVQYITAAVMHLESASLRLAAESTLREPFQLAIQLLRRSMADARRVLSGLRPPILDEQGIVEAIRYLIAETDASGEITVDFDTDVRFTRLDSLMEGTIFRIVQESLSNVRRHSGSDRAAIAFQQFDDHLFLRIQDWGKGFNLSAVPPQHIGLQGMQRRAALLGGNTKIITAPGEGTIVEVTLPMYASEPEAADRNV